MQRNSQGMKRLIKAAANYRNKRRIEKIREDLKNAIESQSAKLIIKHYNRAWKAEGIHMRIKESGYEAGIYKIIHFGDPRGLYVTSPSRCEWLYKEGFDKRGMLLAQSYGIDKIKINDDDLIIDCGANYGDLNLYFKSQGVEPEYIGVEPSPLDYKCLCLNWGQQDKRRTLENIALGASNGVLEFFLDTETASSSIIRPKLGNVSIKVNSETLDSLCARHHLLDKRIKLLKLEAEGAEPEICAGMQNTLYRVDYIAADLGPERGVAEECTAPFVINFLLERGFKVATFGDRYSLRVLFKNESCP